MKKLDIKFGLGVILMALAGCASKKESPEKPKITHVGHDTQWDHEKIRKVRELEEAQKPSDLELKQKAAEEDSNCSYMSETQMKRSQASGCRPVDPRAGMGANMFCCPKE
jgi:hypothetical protein